MQRKSRKILLNLTTILGLDFHIALTLLFRIWAIIAGGVTILLIPIFLTPVQQGYFYTFTAVIGTQIFFELGLNHVVTQISSQASAHLRRNSSNYFEGGEYWKRRVVSLTLIAKKWNAVMAFLFFFTITAGGYWFFSTAGTMAVSDWFFIWLLLTFSSSVNLALSAQLAICEGLGEVGQISRLRLIQSILGYTLLWTLLFSGAGLSAALAVPISSMLGTIYWLYKRKLVRSLRVIDYSESNLDGICSYSRDVFPLQWRIAISWASAYFIYNFITPIVFAKQGEIEAGKIGLALSAFNSISTVGISWVSAKIPEFGALIARNARVQLNTLFDRNVLRAVGITLSLVIAFTLIINVAGYLNPIVWDRLPQMPVLLILSMTTVINVYVFSMSAYMRAHREEPMLINSIISAFFITIGVYNFASDGLIQTVKAYASIVSIITLPWCYLLFKKYRSRVK
jgi:hypothetical protein